MVWLVTTVAIIGMVVFSAVAYAVSNRTYASSVHLYPDFYAQTGESASRNWNKVYRPTPIDFCLSYPGTAGCVYNAFDNPFLDTRSAFYAPARCWNVDTVAADPTTCITTQP